MTATALTTRPQAISHETDFQMQRGKITKEAPTAFTSVSQAQFVL